MLISIVAWMLRFGLFAYGDPTPFGTVLLVLSMIVYGCAFDFFNISGSVFVEKEVRPEIPRQRLGMFLMMTNGFGCILGGMVRAKWWSTLPSKGYRLANRMADFRRLFAGSGVCFRRAV